MRIAPNTAPSPRPIFAGRVKPSVGGRLDAEVDRLDVDVAEMTGGVVLAGPLVEVDTGSEFEENDEAATPIVSASMTPFFAVQH